LRGENVENNIDEYIQHKKLYHLGRDVAFLYQTMQSYHHEELTQIHPWSTTECLFTLFEDVLPEIDGMILERYEDAKNDVMAIQEFDNDLIHSDLHFANILFDKELEKYKFIDFEDVVFGAVQMDLAIMIFDLPVIIQHKEHQHQIEHVIIELIQGYHSIHPLNAKQVITIPKYLKLLETASYLNFYSYNHSDDSWLQTFFQERKERILKDRPYIDIDIQSVVTQLNM
jgi:Ser/Thr protein kinase RdoA (MazF antagonist)